MSGAASQIHSSRDEETIWLRQKERPLMQISGDNSCQIDYSERGKSIWGAGMRARLLRICGGQFSSSLMLRVRLFSRFCYRNIGKIAFIVRNMLLLPSNVPKQVELLKKSSISRLFFITSCRIGGIKSSPRPQFAIPSF